MIKQYGNLVSLHKHPAGSLGNLDTLQGWQTYQLENGPKRGYENFLP